jgi:hypothetical protein
MFGSKKLKNPNKRYKIMLINLKSGPVLHCQRAGKIKRNKTPEECLKRQN